VTAASFLTEEGATVPAVTADQMREVDRVAIEETGPNLYQMMENAGRSLALTVLDRLGADWATDPVVVLAGTGGNGGGGICAARHLANRGVDVTLVVSDPEGIVGVPADQLSAFRATGGREAVPGELPSSEVAMVVDALIGYGLRGAPRGSVAELIGWTASQSTSVISLDVPSGLVSTTGELPGVAISADLTLTLALPKTGLDSPAVGDLWLADIGIPIEAYRRIGLEVPVGLFGPRYRIPLAVAPG
jgi:NAD(P)H-hydrate epimerase